MAHQVNNVFMLFANDKLKITNICKLPQNTDTRNFTSDNQFIIFMF